MQIQGNRTLIVSALVAIPSVLLACFYLWSYHIADFFPAEPTEPPTEPTIWNDAKWAFQDDVPGFRLPKFDVTKLSTYPAHNYQGPGHPTFALFYVSRNATDADPYFIATQQIVYRLLWDPSKKSAHIPVTVFVTPAITQHQKQILLAAGANVREIGFHEFEPTIKGTTGRLRDMMSKLEMWRQTDFSRIAYLDSDAFPLQNIDGIFDLAPEQVCRMEQLESTDRVRVSSICRYVFAGYIELGDTVNAGVMVLKPDQAMYTRLIRESMNKTGWDTGFMEQALLNKAFHKDGPFPPSTFGHEWNSGKDQRGILDIRIMHNKSWDPWERDEWVINEYNQTWHDMLKLYESPEFEKMRSEDLKIALAGLTKRASAQQDET